MWHRMMHWFGWIDIQVVGFWDGERSVICTVCKQCGKVVE